MRLCRPAQELCPVAKFAQPNYWEGNFMETGKKKASQRKRWAVGFILALALLTVCGCQTLGFYTQAIKGQYQLVTRRKPIEKLLTNPQTPARLKQQLELLQRLRAFAAQDLQLPVDDHYSKYVDIGRRFVVWNVEAAPEFSLEPKGWWYPVVGKLEYRGYFSERAARNYAEKLKKKHYDVYVGGVTAYSTLGWFNDPVLNTFIFNPEPDLAETVFHELGHQQVFARGDTDFNEAFATTVGEEGARRWLKAKGDEPMLRKYLASLRRTRDFVRLIMTTRDRLETLYGDVRTESGRLQATDRNRQVPLATLREQKEELLARLNQEYSELKAQWGGETDYDEWFAPPVNNAKLNAVAAYYELVPGFEQLLKLHHGDLKTFYTEAKKLAELSKKERHERLRTLSEIKEQATQ
jgi:predicted aminopeptidase